MLTDSPIISYELAIALLSSEAGSSMSPVKGGVVKGDCRDPPSDSRYSHGLLLPR